MKTKNVAFSVSLTLAVLLIGFYVGSMFPFGEGTVSWCDMNQQGIPLLCDFKDILEGKDGMFLNFQNAFGMNFYGIFFYYLASPFSLLCLFVDKVDIPYLINVILILKLTLSALTASLYFSKRFRNLSLLENGVLSAAYGLCGYGMLFFQNLMWLDIMYMLPLLMLGIYLLINENKPLLYTVSLTLTLIMNYYISYMVLLFIILYFGIFTVRRVIVNNRTFVDLGVSTLSSLMISAFVILPSYLQYTESARGADIFSGILSTNFFGNTYTTVPVMLCTAMIFASALMVLPRLHLQSNIFKSELLIFLLLLVPLFIEPINLMWHTGNYMAFPARFAFITTFIGLCLAADFLEKRETVKENKYKFLLLAVCTVIVICYIIIWYTKNNLHTLTAYVNTLWGDRESFRGLLILFIFTLIGYFVILYFSQRQRISKKFCAILLCIMIFAEGICSISIYVNSAANKFNYNNYREFLKLENSVDKDEFYRVNLDKKFIDANMTGATGFNSLGHYTSLNNTNTMLAAKQLGYSGYWMETGNWGGCILSDALMSVKYTAAFTNGEYVLNKNPYYLGMGIKTKAKLPENIPDRERIEEIGKLFAQITGTNNSVIKYMPSKTDGCNIEKSNNTKPEYFVNLIDNTATVTYNISITEPQRLYFDCYNGFSTNLTEKINNSTAIFVNGKSINSDFPTQSYNGLIDLGSYENCGLEIRVIVFEDIVAQTFGIWGVNENIVSEAMSNSETLDLIQKGGKLYGTVKEAGNYFLSVPYSDNLKITLNGKDVEFSKALTGFVSVNLEGGGDLQISATPKGFTLGVIISILGILFFAMYLFFLRNKVCSKPFLKRAVYAVFCIVFAIMLLVIYVLPICINLFG